MPGSVVILGLFVYPLTVHALVLLGFTQAAVIGLIAVSIFNLLMLKVRGRAVLPYVVLHALVTIAAVLNVFTGEVYALFLPPVLVDLALMVFFGQSLRAGDIPLVERFMRLEYQDGLAPALQAHARVATWIWTLFFAFVAATSLVLAWLAPLAVWSWFVNVANFIMITALFVVQHGYRMVRFRRFGRVMPWVVIARLMRLPLSDPAHPLFSGARR